jgi:hypothetical protein
VDAVAAAVRDQLVDLFKGVLVEHKFDALARRELPFFMLAGAAFGMQGLDEETLKRIDERVLTAKFRYYLLADVALSVEYFGHVAAHESVYCKVLGEPILPFLSCHSPSVADCCKAAISEPPSSDFKGSKSLTVAA